VTVSDDRRRRCVTKIEHVNVPKTAIAEIGDGSARPSGRKAIADIAEGNEGRRFLVGNGIPKFEATAMRERLEAYAAGSEGLAVGENSTARMVPYER